MKVILLEDVKALGKKGEIVNVKLLECKGFYYYGKVVDNE